MKKILLLFIGLLTLTSFNNFTKSDEFNIVGKWENGDNIEEKKGLVFKIDGFAFIIYGDKIVGGKEFDMDGEKRSMSYTIDYSKEPLEFDIIIKKFDLEEVMKFLGIVKVINNDKIMIIMDTDGVRPVDFDSEDTITFERVN